MSKWRPGNSSCLYVIPDIHGAYGLLEKILKRILPLRRTGGVQDKIIFLGDFIDRHVDSHKVLDKVIELKSKYDENVICLCGNHELMLLEGLGLRESESPSAMWDMWVQQGGVETALGYMHRDSGENIETLFSNYTIDKDKLLKLIPQNHIDFLLNDLDPFYEEGNFIFVHGGCNPTESLSKYPVDVLCWDRSLLKFAEEHVVRELDLPWDKTVITGHNSKGGKPFIHPKFMMIDCGSPKRLMVIEANSMEAFMSSPDKSKLVKYELKETVIKKKKPLFRRSN